MKARGKGHKKSFPEAQTRGDARDDSLYPPLQGFAASSDRMQRPLQRRWTCGERTLAQTVIQKIKRLIDFNKGPVEVETCSVSSKEQRGDHEEVADDRGDADHDQALLFCL